MSAPSSNPPKKALQLSKHRSSFTRAKAKKDSKDGGKDHGYDTRNFHQNANRREIRSLVRFDCPVCKCKNTCIVQLESVKRLATVKCGVCLSLQPPPDDLPYPYQTSFVPHLENKADVFFRFQDELERLMKSAGGVGSSSLRSNANADVENDVESGEDVDGGALTRIGTHVLDGLDLTSVLALQAAQEGEDNGSGDEEEVDEGDAEEVGEA